MTINKINKTPHLARNKIKSIEELGQISAKSKADGNNIVLCHGVFDLLHMGHIRHLEAARHEGSLLIVTITADEFVNKGPGRPVFSEQMRAEMLSAIEHVDWVGINYAPSASTVLNIVKPNIYVKGNDYKISNDDITGGIISEQQTVEEHGGKIVFTDELTFSSSELINQYLGIYEPTLQQYLDNLRGTGFLDSLLKALDNLKNMKILFVGDAIIDEYQYVTAMGKSAKENMIATRFKEKEIFAGGVFAAANHIADFCKEVEIITCFGSYDSYEELAHSSVKDNVTINAIYRQNSPTTRKCRFIDTDYSMRKLFEVYFMDDNPLGASNKDELHAMLQEKMSDYDLVVTTDFGHGFINDDIVDLLMKQAPFLAVNCQSNSGNYGFNLVSKYKKADYICIDGPEARLAVHDKHSTLEEIISDKLPNIIECDNFIVTQGKHGCLALNKDQDLHKIPALTSTIVDTVGAGDAFFSLTAPLVAAGMPMDQVAFIGNAAGALKVGVVGHRSSVEKIPLVKFLTALLK